MGFGCSVIVFGGCIKENFGCEGGKRNGEVGVDSVLCVLDVVVGGVLVVIGEGVGDEIVDWGGLIVVGVDFVWVMS